MCKLQIMDKSKKDEKTRQFIANVSIDNQSIPLWEVSNIYGFTKFLGHAKFINNQYGSILFRGQTKIYPSFQPSAYRNASVCVADSQVEEMIKVLSDDKGKDDNPTLTVNTFIKADKTRKGKAIIEAILQHYGFGTRFMDVVDNQWVALWFASHRRMCDNEFCPDYSNCKKCYESMRYMESTAEYSYIYLIGVPDEKGQYNQKGIVQSSKHCLVDIRRACPSTILRPHMQHGMVVSFYDDNCNFKKSYAEQIIAIIRIKTQTCLEWLRGDKTLTANALFPCPAHDGMYEMILETRKDLFESLEKNHVEEKPCPA